jgi:hypothetical protein
MLKIERGRMIIRVFEYGNSAAKYMKEIASEPF